MKIRSYGYRRLYAMLGYEGLQLSEKVLCRLMVEVQLIVSCNRHRRYSLYFGKIGPAPDNLIARDFKAEQPNQKCLTDITEFQLPAGKVWLLLVVDCFDGNVVSWPFSTCPDVELVNLVTFVLLFEYDFYFMYFPYKNNKKLCDIRLKNRFKLTNALNAI